MAEAATTATPDPGDVLSSADVCRLLGITRPTLFAWIKAGKLKPWKRLIEGSTYLFLRSFLDPDGLRKYARGAAGAPAGPSPSRDPSTAGVLLVSEDGAMIPQVLSAMRRLNYRVSLLPDEKRLGEALRGGNLDVLILDMDSRSGAVWKFLARARGKLEASGDQAPALFVVSSEYGSPGDAARVLKGGASDFLRKPFAMEVLSARVRRLMKSRLWSEMDAKSPENTVTSRDGTLAVNRDIRTLSVSGADRRRATAVARLTRKEADLLCLFLRRPGRIFTKPMLLEVVWGYLTSIKTRTLDSHIMSLRRKLGPQRDRIETHYGLGYRFIDNPTASASRP